MIYGFEEDKSIVEVQPSLISGENIKTINNESILGSGNLNLVDFFYPVGSYYETSDVNFNPNTTWGGTWVLETAGQVHVSAGTGYVVNGATTNTSDGGATTHNHGGKTGDVTLKAAQSGHQALTYTDTTYKLNTTNRKPGTSTAVAYGTSITGTATSRTIAAKDATSAHNHTISSNSNMQPYIIVNRWHRTA